MVNKDKIEFFVDANLHNDKTKSVENARLFFRTEKSFSDGLSESQIAEKIQEKLKQVSLNPVFGIHNTGIAYSYSDVAPKELKVNTKVEVRIPYCLHIPEETFLPIKMADKVVYAAFHKIWTDRANGSSDVDVFQESKVTYFQKAQILPGAIPQEEKTGWDINPTGVNVEKINDVTGLFRYTKTYLYFETERNSDFENKDYFKYFDEIIKVEVLEIINHIIDIYRFCTREIHVERIAQINITDVFFYDTQEGIHPISPYIEAAIMNRSKKEIDTFSDMLCEGNKPPLYELLLLSAERSLHKQMFTLAIVESFQALEIYLENVLIEKYKEKGNTEDEIEAKLKDCWRTNERLKKGLSESAGFALTEDDNLWQNWLKSYKEVRNEVIHHGKESTYPESEQVIGLNIKVINFIKDRLKPTD